MNFFRKKSKDAIIVTGANLNYTKDLIKILKLNNPNKFLIGVNNKPNIGKIENELNNDFDIVNCTFDNSGELINYIKNKNFNVCKYFNYFKRLNQLFIQIIILVLLIMIKKLIFLI